MCLSLWSTHQTDLLWSHPSPPVGVRVVSICAHSFACVLARSASLTAYLCRTAVPTSSSVTIKSTCPATPVNVDESAEAPSAHPRSIPGRTTDGLCVRQSAGCGRAVIPRLRRANSKSRALISGAAEQPISHRSFSSAHKSAEGYC